MLLWLAIASASASANAVDGAECPEVATLSDFEALGWTEE